MSEAITAINFGSLRQGRGSEQCRSSERVHPYANRLCELMAFLLSSLLGMSDGREVGQPLSDQDSSSLCPRRFELIEEESSRNSDSAASAKRLAYWRMSPMGVNSRSARRAAPEGQWRLGT